MSIGLCLQNKISLCQLWQQYTLDITVTVSTSTLILDCRETIPDWWDPRSWDLRYRHMSTTRASWQPQSWGQWPGPGPDTWSPWLLLSGVGWDWWYLVSSLQHLRGVTIGKLVAPLCIALIYQRTVHCSGPRLPVKWSTSSGYHCTPLLCKQCYLF